MDGTAYGSGERECDESLVSFAAKRIRRLAQGPGGCEPAWTGLLDAAIAVRRACWDRVEAPSESLANSCAVLDESIARVLGRAPAGLHSRHAQRAVLQRR